MDCEQCKKRTATVHLTDLTKGGKRERHLCEECAVSEGVTVKQHIHLNEVLNSFLMAQAPVKELAKLRCPQCGMTFVEFRNQGLLGCPQDYDVFGEALAAVVERAQDGATHHTGRTEGGSREADPKHEDRLRLQRELREAVEVEDYERAARVRDRLAELESA